MNNDRLFVWLNDLGLGVYWESFQKNAIDWDTLSDLNDEDLKGLGVLLGHRKKILRAIVQMSSDTDAKGGEEISNSTELFQVELTQAERRLLTVMFCDLVNSTSLSYSLDPEEFQEIVRRFLDTCNQAIGRFEGYIAKYMSDGVLVYFGYPRAHENDAERAVHTGLAILEALKRLHQENLIQGFDIAARIGIATGQVIVGEEMGHETAKERSVFGETPNLAARLQAFAEPNQVIIDLATKRLIGNEFEFADLGSLSLKGFETLVPAWQVLSFKLAASRFEAHSSRLFTNFVGRDHEILLLVDRWHDACGGEGQAILVCGEAGIGKSRVVQMLRDRTAKERHHLILYQCSPYYINTALYPAITYLRQVAGIISTDSSQEMMSKFNALATESGIEDQESASLLMELLTVQENPISPLHMSPEKRKNMILEALIRQLQSMSNRYPVFFIVEDAHWIDPTTLDLITRIIGRIRNMRILLLITFRPEFKPNWQEHGHVTTLTLNRLVRKHSAELITTITGGKSLPPEVQQIILSKTDGVPLYIEELTKNVLESGLLTEDAHSFILNDSLDTLKTLSIPESLQALLMERVDRIGIGKEILQTGATIGREFPYDLLRAVVEATDSQLRNILDIFVASGVIHQEGYIPTSNYIFKHIFVQEAAYSTLLKKTRQQLHARIAKTLEKEFPGRVKMEPELLAYHYEQARLFSPALSYWRIAASKAVENSANIEALNHFDRALNLLSALPQDEACKNLELELLIARGAPLMSVKGYASDEMVHNFLRAKNLSHETSDFALQFHANWGLWIFHMVSGHLITDALGLAEKLLSLAVREQNPDFLVEAHRSLGTTYFYIGRFDEAKIQLLNAKELYDPNQHRTHVSLYAKDPGIIATIYLARTLWILGETEKAESLALEAISMARELDHPYTLAFTLGYLTWLYSGARNPIRALELAEEASKISAQYSFKLSLAWAQASHGWAVAKVGRVEGIDELISGLSSIRATGASVNNTYTMALLAELYLLQELSSEGLDIIKDAQVSAVSQGELFWQAELFRLQGELLLIQANPLHTEAEQCFYKAMEIARHQNAKMLELRATVSLAKFWKKTNQLEKAKDILNSVYSSFAEGCESPDLVETKTLLEQMLSK